MKLETLLFNTVKYLKESLKRFPVTILTSTALVIMLIITGEQSSTLNSETLSILERINMVIGLGIPLSLCIKLVFERKNGKNQYKLLGHILGAGFLILYYFYFLSEINMVSRTRYIAISLFLYIAFMYIPWLGNKKDYEYYVVKVLGSFFITAIYSFVLYIGFTAIIFSIDKLFLINIEGRLYYYMFLVIVGIFAPSYFLAKLPNNNENFSNNKLPKAFKILLLYIIIPLIVIYTAILYAYFIKIIVTRNWPINLISHLVLWYSIVTVGVIFFITPIIKEDKVAEYFVKWFPNIIIPIILMMFSSMYIRINAYGITENRYFVLVLGLWVFAMMIYFGFRKRFRNIIVPISMSILVLISVIGPLSSYSISKYSQNKRLERILIRNNMIEDNKIIKSNSSISSEDKAEISSILDYFKNNHDVNNIKYLSSDFKINDMERVFGFSYTYDVQGEDMNSYFYYDNDKIGNVLEVRGFDYFANINNYVDEVKISTDIVLKFDFDKFTFKIIDKENDIYERNFYDFVEIINSKYEGKNGSKDIVDPKDLIFSDENKKVKVLFIINHISGLKDGSQRGTQIQDVEFNVLIKIK